MLTEIPVLPREIVHDCHIVNPYSVGLNIVMYFPSRDTILKIHILLSTKNKPPQTSYYKVQESSSKSKKKHIAHRQQPVNRDIEWFYLEN
jgi:hypothetical protein